MKFFTNQHWCKCRWLDYFRKKKKKKEKFLQASNLVNLFTSKVCIILAEWFAMTAPVGIPTWHPPKTRLVLSEAPSPLDAVVHPERCLRQINLISVASYEGPRHKKWMSRAAGSWGSCSWGFGQKMVQCSKLRPARVAALAPHLGSGSASSKQTWPQSATL